MPIINTLLDTDLYKLTMMQAAYLNHPDVRVRYKFFCRQPEVNFSQCLSHIKDEIDHLCQIGFTQKEIDYLDSLFVLQPRFRRTLQNFQLSQDCISVRFDNGELAIHTSGYWWETILFEVPVLAIVNECYFQERLPLASTLRADAYQEGWRRLLEKDALLNKYAPPHFSLVEFGTRRRFSREWQNEVLEYLLRSRIGVTGECPVIGTSNVHLARTLGIPALGTMAHEWLQAFQALGPLQTFQQRALESWLLTYRGQLGIALTDCITYNRFERIFDLLLAKAYDGVRHDSGDPYRWANSVISHYRYLGIDPTTKTAVFSDGLDIMKAINLAKTFGHQINCQFGIGTSLTNDLGERPLSIVMKMIECNHQPVAKISDAPGKTMDHDRTYLQHLWKTFHLSSG